MITDPATDSVKPGFSLIGLLPWWPLIICRASYTAVRRNLGMINRQNLRPALGWWSEKIIERATIVKDGQLTERFAYLDDYVKPIKHQTHSICFS